jgi:hypothetical protein
MIIEYIIIALLFNICANLPLAIIFTKQGANFKRILVFGFIALIFGYFWDVWWKEKYVIANIFSAWVFEN